MADAPIAGKADLVDGEIVIRLPVDNLGCALEGAWALHYIDAHFTVTDPQAFAKEVMRSLNNEDEQGTTLIHRMFDKAMLDAIEQGAEGVEELPGDEDGPYDAHDHEDDA